MSFPPKQTVTITNSNSNRLFTATDDYRISLESRDAAKDQTWILKGNAGSDHVSIICVQHNRNNFLALTYTPYNELKFVLKPYQANDVSQIFKFNPASVATVSIASAEDSSKFACPDGNNASILTASTNSTPQWVINLN
uniref:Citrate synthase n=1 Tax=Anthurium amnicola TaxID=1678845 RepID=A0A1D1XF10_9ARAE